MRTSLVFSSWGSRVPSAFYWIEFLKRVDLLDYVLVRYEMIAMPTVR